METQSIKFELLRARLENLDEWGENYGWWVDLFQISKNLFKDEMSAVVRMLEVAVDESGYIDPAAYCRAVTGYLALKKEFNDHLLEEFSALIFKGQPKFLKEVIKLSRIKSR